MNAIEKAKEALDIALGRTGVFNPPELDLMCEAYEALQSLEVEAVYAFRRKGQDDFCTCSESRYLELMNKQDMFEVTVFYTTPQPPAVPDGLPDKYKVSIPLKLAEFLLGESAIGGKWFGDDTCPKFWWRKEIRSAIQAQQEDKS